MVLFSRNFAYAKFRENKILANGEITLSFTDRSNLKSCPSRNFYIANMSFNANSRVSFRIYSSTFTE